MEDMHTQFVSYVRELYGSSDYIPLHEPKFGGNEKKYLSDVIDSTFVSSVGKYVDTFEKNIANYCGVKYAVAAVNGTAALHTALKIAGVKHSDEVITQPLTFVASGNTILYCGAVPVFIDVDKDTMGLSPKSLEDFLEKNCKVSNGNCLNVKTGRRVAACIPMHTFGFPARINEISEICNRFHVKLIEDAAESIGSYVGDKHTGSFGIMGVLSFNGNKTITCGGGGIILTNDDTLAKRAKHITTTAKRPHKWEYFHDELGYNYRMPNLNAALACAQLEQLDLFLKNKKQLADLYSVFFAKTSTSFIKEIKGTKANYWLNTILLKDKAERDIFLEYTNSNKVMTRPAWTLLNKLPAFKEAFVGNIENSLWLEERLVNIPSSVSFK